MTVGIRRTLPAIDEFPVKGSTTITKNKGVCANSSGYAVPAADTSGLATLGIARETVVNSGSDGDELVAIERYIRVRLAGDTLTQADVGRWVYWVDAETVGPSSATTHAIAAGVLVEYVSATEGVVDVTGPVDSPTVSAGSLSGTQSANVATENVIGALPVLHIVTAAALTGDQDVVLTHKTRVVQVWCVATAAGGAADTITVKNGATAITDDMDLNVSDKVIVRAATIDDAQHVIAAGGTLRVSGASGASAIVYVLGVRVA